MAEQQDQTPPTETTVQVEEKELKYLDFVQVAVLYSVVWVSGMYEYAKKNAGPLKPGVNAVEGTVKTVIGPVYEKLHDIPFELLKFVDHKMDELLKEINNHVPSLLKEIHRSGIVDTGSHLAKTVYTKYEPTAKGLYTKYEPLAENYAVSAWRTLNGIPLFPQVAGIMVPTGVYCAEKYNQTVLYIGDRGFAVAGYMPVVPIARIGKIFEGGERDVAINE